MRAILNFYIDGFNNMRIGRTLWKIILIKLVIIFAILKVFFFPNVLETRFDNDPQRAEHVLSRLTVAGEPARGEKTNRDASPDPGISSTDPNHGGPL